MKISLKATCGIVALLAAARGVEANPKAPVNTTCPIVVQFPTSANFPQDKGGCVWIRSAGRQLPLSPGRHPVCRLGGGG